MSMLPGNAAGDISTALVFVLFLIGICKLYRWLATDE